MNPSSGHVRAERLDVAAGGDVMAARLWRAPAPAGLVALVHGLGEHGGRYAAFASDLVDAGYTAAAVDWPGHGQSPGARATRRGPPSATRSCRRSPSLRAAGGGDRPVVLLGHSMGGAMALDYALAHPGTIDAVVASAPALRAAPPPWWKLLAGRVLHAVAPGIGLAHGLPLEGLSRNPEVVELYGNDPLVHGVISPRLYFGLAEAQARVLARAGTLAIEALVLAGSANPVVDPSGARDFVAAAPPGRARFVSCDDAYHEILNEAGRERVVREIVAWLGAVAHAARAG